MDSAAGFRVLRAVGNEAEKELPFAAAQQLCVPSLATLHELPAPHSDALGVAFGHLAGPPPDRLFVGLALLGLLSQLASNDPVLCVVDDAQWLDRESAQAFAIAARRLGSEHIAFLFGARTVPTDLTGLPCLPSLASAQSDAHALLRSVLPDPFDEHVLERILAETRGNPLALLELPRGLTPAELAGGFTLPRPSRLAGRIEASFQRRIAKLPTSSRRLLLVAAAEPTGDPALVWRAAQHLGVDESLGSRGPADGLLEMSPQVIFRHPLVRSAVYEAAAPADRRDAHRALAEATDAAFDPDRRAWHLAQAAWRPDDEWQMTWRLSADRAQARGGMPQQQHSWSERPNSRSTRSIELLECSRPPKPNAKPAPLRLHWNSPPVPNEVPWTTISVHSSRCSEPGFPSLLNEGATRPGSSRGRPTPRDPRSEASARDLPRRDYRSAVCRQTGQRGPRPGRR